MEKDKTAVIGHEPAVSRIVLNIPHSSTAFPSREDAEAWPEAIQSQINRWTDWFTDIIFDSVDPRVVPVVFPYSRFYCDVERLIDDPLELQGQGIFYVCFEGLHRHWTDDSRDIAMKWYHRHIDRLHEAIIDPDTLLIDCHSFPADLSEVDICVGLNDDWSRPDYSLVVRTASHFLAKGYSVKVNDPYSNSISPETGFRYSSLMIEVNKRTYLQGEKQLDMIKAFALQRSIEEYLMGILEV